MISENVSVQDPDIGRTLLLLSRNAFEEVVMENLTPDDRTAYLLYKSTNNSPGSKPR